MSENRYNELSDNYDPSRFYSESAYTTPTEGEPLRFSRPGYRRRRKGFPLGVLCAILLLAVNFTVLYLLISNNLSLRANRASHLDGVDAPAQTNGGSLVPGDANASAGSPAASIVQWGTDEAKASDKLPDTNVYMSAQWLYRKCAPSVVAIGAGSSDPESLVTGSGVILSEDGYIVTNTHIISGAETIAVRLFDGDGYYARVVGSDPATGLAVIKIEAENLTPAEFCKSSEIEVGQTAMSIGNPVPGSFSLTSGLISSQYGQIKYDGFINTVFQTNAQCGSGSSGSPVLNELGQVIGIINTDMAGNYDLGNISMAIPTHTVIPIVDELIEYGYVSGRPDLGVELVDLPMAAVAYYGKSIGVFVEKVFENTDAWNKGLARGDIIVSVNNQRVSSIDELNEVKNALSVGDTVVLGVYRNRETYFVEVELVDMAALG